MTILCIQISEGFYLFPQDLHIPTVSVTADEDVVSTSLGISTFNTHNSDAQVSQSFTCTESHRDSVERRHGGDGGRVPHVINITTWSRCLMLS